MFNFERPKLLPPYIFSVVDALKRQALLDGKTIFDFGMGNPDGATPQPVIDVLCESAQHAKNHRYSMSKGIPELRQSISNWYSSRFAVDICPNSETIVTLGAKEGLAHMALAVTQPGDVVLTPTPTYPIHTYGFVIAGANCQPVLLENTQDFLKSVIHYLEKGKPKPKGLIINFPTNPGALTVDESFFAEIVALAKKHQIWVIHDLAYADIAFDGYKVPSILQVKGAKDVAVEAFSMSKSFNMSGWRIGFMSGNAELVGALTHVKSYLDYGLFAPIQEAATFAIQNHDKLVAPIRETYQRRRDILCDGLNKMGWSVDKPRATMFVWARIPESFKSMDSLSFTKHLLEKSGVAVSPGIGFGHAGDAYVRFALIVDEANSVRALERIDAFLMESNNQEKQRV